jgi:hypothetical protein
MFFLAVFVGWSCWDRVLFNIDGDLGRHITIGDYILDNRTIPTRDIFSHTMTGEHLTPHEWLAQVIFALAHRLLGLDGVVLFSALLIATTFTLCYRQCQQRSGLVLVSLGFAILAAATASLHWLARPHIFTLLFVVLWTGMSGEPSSRQIPTLVPVTGSHVAVGQYPRRLYRRLRHLGHLPVGRIMGILETQQKGQQSLESPG